MDKNMNQGTEEAKKLNEKARQKNQTEHESFFGDIPQQTQQSGTNFAGSSSYAQDGNVSQQLRQESRNFMGSVGSIGATGSLGATGSTRFTGAINPASNQESPSASGGLTPDEVKRANEKSRQDKEQ